jgi:hypothetical protein
MQQSIKKMGVFMFLNSLVFVFLSFFMRIYNRSRLKLRKLCFSLKIA